MAVDVSPEEEILAAINEPYIGLTDEEKIARLKWDTPAFAAFCSTIVNKSGQRQRLLFKPEQLRWWRALRAQHEAGLPMRILDLKARQVGISTAAQDVLVQRVTQQSDHRALV